MRERAEGVEHLMEFEAGAGEEAGVAVDERAATTEEAIGDPLVLGGV